MSYIKRKRRFHPILVVLYVLLYVGVIAYAFSLQDYSAEFQSYFLLKPLFPTGVHIPVFITLFVLAGALFVSGYFMHEVLVKRFELSRKLNLHFFIIPLLLLPAQNLLEMTMIALLMTVASITLSFVLSMAAIQIDIKKVFLSGFLAGILFLFNGAVVVFLVLFPLLLFANRGFSVKAVLTYGFAFVLPFGYFLTYLYLIDFTQWELFFEGNSFDLLSYEHIFNYLHVSVLAFLILLIIIVTLRVHLRLSEFKIAIRRAYYSTLFFLLVLMTSIVLMPEVYLPSYVSVLIFIVLFYYLRMISEVKRNFILAVLHILPFLVFGLNYYFLAGNF